ncbi:putative transcription factor interactor and regulator CCHC(Zn) family [Arabidopsis thaliana]
MISSSGSSRDKGVEAIPGGVVAVVDPPDPRWPYLHRWTQESSSPPVKPPPNTPLILSAARIGLSNSRSIRDYFLPAVSIDSATTKSQLAPLVKSLIEIATPTIELVVQRSPLPLRCRLSKELGRFLATSVLPLIILQQVKLADTSSTQRWPSLVVSSGKKRMTTVGIDHSKDSKVIDRSRTVEDESLKVFSKDYPWAAKMDQSKRNLHRVTTPDYLEHGTPLRALWHVDDCLMFVSTWSPVANFEVPEITTIPAWLTLKNIPNQLYSFKGIKWIASGIGETMLTSRPWLDPTQMGEAKILVEVKLDKPFPQRVALKEECGSITMVDVVYSWLPSKCSLCGHLGHKSSRCLGLGLEKTVVSACNNGTPLNENSIVNASTKALDTAIVSNGAAILKGFHKTVDDTSVLPLQVIGTITDFLSSSNSKEETVIGLGSIAITDAR